MFEKTQENMFSFSPLSKKEKKEQAQTQKEIEQRISEAIETAAQCLNSDLFAKYKEKYAEAERGLIEFGIQMNIVNPIHYAVAAKNIFTNLKLLKMLGDVVTKDAQQKR